MATAKKTAKKAAAKPAKKGKEKPLARTQVPDGFKATSSSFAPGWHPWQDDSQPSELTGEWGEERTVEVRRGRGTQEQRVCNLTTEDGETYAIWCSSGLAGLFDEAKEGDTVFIAYEGEGPAKKGQNPPRIFTTGIAE